MDSWKIYKGTANAIFIVSNIVKDEPKVQSDVYTCIVDCTIDEVKQEDILQVLTDLQFDGKDIRVTINLMYIFRIK